MSSEEDHVVDPKEEEKGTGPDERYEKNPLGYLTLAIVLFWVGIYLLFRNRHVFADTDQGWAYLFWGVAALGFLEIIIRAMVPGWRRPIVLAFSWAAIATGVGVGLWTGGNWEIVGPVAFIAVVGALAVARLARRL
jgi:hypothetical protein